MNAALGTAGRVYAAGPLAAYGVACAQEDMIQPAPLREVAAIVAAALYLRPDPVLTAT